MLGPAPLAAQRWAHFIAHIKSRGAQPQGGAACWGVFGCSWGNVDGAAALSFCAQRMAHIRSPRAQPHAAGARSPELTLVALGAGGGGSLGVVGAEVGWTSGATAVAGGGGAGASLVEIGGASTQPRDTQIRAPLQSVSLPQPASPGGTAGTQPVTTISHSQRTALL